MSRFLDADVIHQQVERCPLASLPQRVSEAACAACTYNLAYPGRPRVGCIVNTPTDVFHRALARLKERSPGLHREVEDLRAGPPVDGGGDDPRARRWLEIAETWYVDAKKSADTGVRSADEETEVSMVIARFARAAIARGEPVEILR